MKALGIIPARFNSSRFPGKPLIDLKGKSMIQRVYEGAKNSSLLQKVIVATDDERIFDEVIKFGGEVEMTSKNHHSGTERCNEVAEKFSSFEVIINIQGDEPLVDYRQLDALLSCDWTREVATCQPDYYGHEQKIFLDFWRKGLAYRKEILSQLCNLPACALEKMESLEQLRWLYYGYDIHLIETEIETPNIDMPEDVLKVLELIK